MLIVGDNLVQLSKQYGIIDRNDAYDDTCLSVKLGNKIKLYVPNDGIDILTYSEKIPSECIQERDISDSGLIIPKMSAVLACSAETIKIPMGYFGLLQTKGSLARMLVSLHFSDGQIDPGFEGIITFEIFNASCYDIRIPKKQPVGSLYIFKTSTKTNKPYNGRYASAVGPTHPLVEE